MVNSKKILMLVLVSIFLVNIAYGLGVSPAVNNIEYLEGTNKTYSIDVFNSEKKAQEIKFVVDGPLQDYIIIHDEIVSFTEMDEKKTVKFSVHVPSGLEPGLHISKIKAYSVTDTENEDQIQIKTQVAVTSNVVLNIPYPGKYAKVKLESNNPKRGEGLNFYVSIFNLGQENLKEVYSVLNIYDLSGKFIKTLKTESKGVAVKKTGELVISMDSVDFVPGNYYVNATVHYDGLREEVRHEFEVKEFLVKLDSIFVGDYVPKSLAKFTLIVSNIGNRIVGDFVSNIILRDKEKNLVGSMDSFSLAIKPTETKETYAYWDTKDIDFGEYYGVLTMKYEDNVLERNIYTKVTENEIKVEVTNELTGLAVDEMNVESPGLAQHVSMNTILIVVLIILMGIVLFQMRKKK